MNYKTLIKEADVRTFKAAEMAPGSISAEGKFLVEEVLRRLPSALAAFVRRASFDESLELSSHNAASGPWYADRKIRCLVWPGDLTIKGDLLDDDFNIQPLLIVRGNLTVRSWLRGGMPAFVGGSVKASGFVVGYYNDSPLFVGGDLTAAGYIPRAKPYVDLPKVMPHQIAGKIDARKFDNLNASSETLKATFVKEVLTEDDEGSYLDEKAVIERANAGRAVWR